jgi:hypothetical protein
LQHLGVDDAGIERPGSQAGRQFLRERLRESDLTQSRKESGSCL